MWDEKPAGALLRLPRFLASALAAGRPGGFWLQADGCYSKASWVEAEVTAASNVFLNRGWQSFAHARDLHGRCTLHFRYDGVVTLCVRIFEEDGPRIGCYSESDTDDDGERRGGIIAGDDLALGDGRAAASRGGFSSAERSSGNDSDELQRRRARIRRGDESRRRRTW